MIGELFRLRPDVSVVVTPAAELYLVTWLRGQRVGKRSASLEGLLAKLATEYCSGERLYELAGARRPVDRLLTLLRRGGWLQVTRVQDSRHLYTVSPLRPGARRRPTTTSGHSEAIGCDVMAGSGVNARTLAGAHDTATTNCSQPSAVFAPVQPFGGLSRFTVVRREGDDFLMESPLADADIIVHDPGLLRYLAGQADDPVAIHFQGALLKAGLAVGPADGERGEFRLAQWTPHELWFHAFSRAATRGRVDDRFGATSWGRGRFLPLPARPQDFPGARISLHRPDLAALRRDDTRLTVALEDRKSVRSYGADPLTLTQVGEFLFRCARARKVTPGEVELVDRVYPSGGQLGELELYLVVEVVAGLEPGIYHYDSHEHCLVATGATAGAARSLLADAGGLLVPPGRPPLLIVVTARFGRLMWKYKSLSYALTLKHVGALYQAMYLVATAMGLAPCALGTGDSEAFCDAVGLDYLTESSVGEFALGVPAADRQEAS